ncbi:MAG: hypothetical protein A2Y00_09325 [Omnitrophica WOR_2 bacterium GWF2_43_52]|nr:MAG: hypothetical protein A2062_06525 [Omnitrophica WOR_2 bacterium GWA2_44_7]OGX18140.1 MAG: hypothetical protein A2Y01_04950 [Omnitrophica WOR_2 bacterium GWC2_44_8]OGX21960.1 MAG: hypothetical protein A2Y00_09325 [Omnitrophica WOR_2 bacterium GWF2_43_52]HAH20030.1 DUF2905 domain-containing protein [Candidatus Omnitrophota bacterium]HBG63071.1 DUF2905 domain-containing protein [Candidatus Omnitrophota bacterium]
MVGFGGLGKALILCGLMLIIVGVFLTVLHKIPFLGKLPGDIYLQKRNFTFYFPLATSLLISLIFSFILWIWPKK